MAAEVEKGNDIIKKLQTDIRNIDTKVDPKIIMCIRLLSIEW